MLLKGGKNSSIKFGSTLSKDQFAGETFDYIIMNPPFGREWKKDKDAVEAEYKKGENGRFKNGLPAISDSQLLFLQNAVSKMNPNGSKVAIVHNASALFQGDAESGSSEIRRYILENDLLDAIIQLPNSIFYNTGIATYIWLLSNKKPKERRGKAQLINASDMFVKRRKALGEKRNDISDEQRAEIVKIYNAFKTTKRSKIFDIYEFGYRKVVVRQKDSKETDTEIIPFLEDIQEYMNREVLPFAPNSFVDESKTKIGYEIPFMKYFYEYHQPRKSADILAEILELDKQLNSVLKELAKDKRSNKIDSKMQIKANWKTEPLKLHFGFGKGLSITKENLVEEGLPVISYGQIHSKDNSGTTITKDLLRFVPDTYLENKNSLVNKDDFIFADTSEDLEGVGNCVYVDKNGVLFAGYHTIILKAKGKNNKFFSYLFKSNFWRSQLRSMAYGTKVYSVTQSMLKQVKIYIPPTDEQKEIVAYLDKRCDQIDQVITYHKNIIEKLEEYKKSLISEAVTGKKEIM